MQKRKCGKSGLELPVIGFGSMRMHGDDFEHWASIVRRAMLAGFTYIDASNTYCSRTNETKVGMGIRGLRREDIILSTKCNEVKYPTADDARRAIDESMEKLGVDYLDFYQLWSLSLKNWNEIASKPGGTMAGIRKAQAEGLIRHVAFTCHDRPERMIELLRRGEFDAVTVQYNLLNRTYEDAVAEAARLGVGVVVMGPLHGGLLACDSPLVRRIMGEDVRSTEEAAFRFVLSNPNVTCAISGMLTEDEIAMDRAIAERFRPFTADERRRVDGTLKRLQLDADALCTGCRYCAPCPEGVGIHEILRLANASRIYGLKEGAKRDYALFSRDWPFEQYKDATFCTDCGACLDKCPQHIDIPAELKKAHEALKQG